METWISFALFTLREYGLTNLKFEKIFFLLLNYKVFIQFISLCFLVKGKFSKQSLMTVTSVKYTRTPESAGRPQAKTPHRYTFTFSPIYQPLLIQPGEDKKEKQIMVKHILSISSSGVTGARVRCKYSMTCWHCFPLLPVDRIVKVQYTENLRNHSADNTAPKSGCMKVLESCNKISRHKRFCEAQRAGVNLMTLGKNQRAPADSS